MININIIKIVLFTQVIHEDSELLTVNLNVSMSVFPCKDFRFKLVFDFNFEFLSVALVCYLSVVRKTFNNS